MVADGNSREVHVLVLLAVLAALRPEPATGTSGGVTLNLQPEQVVVDNGVVQVSLTVPEGNITVVRFGGETNLLNFTEEADNSGGYWDLVWNYPGSGQPTGMIDMLDSTEFEVILESEEQVELSFRSTYNPSGQDCLRLNVDKRLVMLKGSSGFYCYAIFEHASDWPALNITEARLVFKLNPDEFTYMAISDEIQRYMPRATDRDPPRGEPLAYKEAVLLVDPADPQFKGEVDDKYQYSLDNKDNRVHGWISGRQIGFWVITPSNEFKSGGPLKRELTSHVGPTSLTMFLGTHYVGSDIVVKIEDGEYWKKVMGPVFIYLNSNTDKRVLWEDAKAQAQKEASKWPYSFPRSPDFVMAGQRGSVTGRLLVRDRYLSRQDMPGQMAYVGLAAPGQPGSWMTESKGFQFWARVSASCGSFTIDNVVAGEYNLYAWVPGVLGDYMYTSHVTVAPGHTVNLGDIVFEPPRSGPTLWEIGVPDRSAAELFVPDPNPKYVNKLFLNMDKYRQYGLWERYAELYPNPTEDDLVFTVGQSHHSKDWFFEHVTRKVGNTSEPTMRHIRFNLGHVAADGMYTLRLALAAAHISTLQVQVNGATGGDEVFTTPEIGENNAIARHGEHGTEWMFEFKISECLLKEGENTIGIMQTWALDEFSKVKYEFVGVMYDYLRLEAPSGS